MKGNPEPECRSAVRSTWYFLDLSTDIRRLMTTYISTSVYLTLFWHAGRPVCI